MPPGYGPQVLRGVVWSFATCLRAVFRPTGIHPEPIRLVPVRDSRLDDAGNLRQFEHVVEGWKRWAPGLVSSIGTGNHVSVLKAPHVQDSATILYADRVGAGEPGAAL